MFLLTKQPFLDIDENDEELHKIGIKTEDKTIILPSLINTEHIKQANPCKGDKNASIIDYSGGEREIVQIKWEELIKCLNPKQV